MGAGEEGQCRRNPPLATPIPGQGLDGQTRVMVLGAHPPARADHWCGEFSDAGSDAASASRRAVAALAQPGGA